MTASKNRQLTESGLARELGVSRQAIHDLVKRNILTKSAEGLIDLDTARALIAERVRPSAKTATALPPAAGDLPAQPHPADDLPKSDPNATSYHVAKTLREAAEAQIARHKLALLKGEVIPRDKAERAAMLIGRQVRDALISSRRRVAPYLAAATNVDDCEELLRKDHQQLLDNLAQSLSAIVPTTIEPA